MRIGALAATRFRDGPDQRRNLVTAPFRRIRFPPPPQTRQRHIELEFTIAREWVRGQRGGSPAALRPVLRTGPAMRRRRRRSCIPPGAVPGGRRRGLLQPLPTGPRSRHWFRRGLGCPLSTRRHCGHDRARPGRGRLGTRLRDLTGGLPGGLPRRPGLMRPTGLLLQRGDLQPQRGQRRRHLDQRSRGASPGTDPARRARRRRHAPTPALGSDRGLALAARVTPPE